MRPTIGGAIRQGFRSANRSVWGIAFFAGVSLLIWLLLILFVRVAAVPEELLQPPQAAAQTAPAADRGEERVGDTATGTVTTADRREAALAEAEERGRLALEWVGGAWPVLVLAFLVVLGPGLWLQGGQIGYLATLVRTQRSSISEFWVTGTRVFPALLGAWLMMFLAWGAAVLLGTLLGVIAAAVGLPDWLIVILGLLLFLAVLVGLAWLAIRLAFWFIGIVVEGVGPLAGLRATFRATRGRWWNVFGLVALLGLILFGVSLVLGLVESLGNAIGGPLGGIIGLIATVVAIGANLYLSFVMMAAYLQFYMEAKSSSASAAVPGAAGGS